MRCGDLSRLLVSPLVERAMGFLMVLLIWPTLLAIAFAIRVTAGGPILITDKVVRGGYVVGHSCRFRTTGAGSLVFRALGRALRKYSLDELPAFLSVARGEIRLNEAVRFFGPK